MSSWDQVHRLGQEFAPGKLKPSRGRAGDPGPASDRLNPDRIRTPREALAYIKHLYRTGHMADLAQLLRRRPVFREVWLAIQGSPQILGGAGKERGLVEQAPALLAWGDIVLPPACLRPSSRPSGEVQEIRRWQPCGPPAPGCGSWALSIYESQEQYFSKEQKNRPLIDLRV